MTTRTYAVDGMTCGHCVVAVEEEVGRCLGVQKVNVDLTAGTLTVTAEQLDTAAVAAAVQEAGYALREDDR